ncbi:MAG: hypothetical protein RL885_19110 [Planctomycetota bacterium]
MTMTKSLTMLFAALVLLALPLSAQDAEKKAGKLEKASTKSLSLNEVQVPTLGNDKCPISGNPVKAGSFAEKDGERVYFCCDNCAGKGKADPAAFLAKAYPVAKKVGNKKCPMSGQPIKDDKAKLVKWQGHEVSLCCGNCEKSFGKDPKLFVAKATMPKVKDLGNEKCPGSGHDVESGKFAIYQLQLVHFCCDDCVDAFKESPKEMMAKIKKDGK